jgi:O-Antigen ligase
MQLNNFKNIDLKNIDLKNIFLYILAIYVIALFYLYPYGIQIGGDNSVRIPDIIVLILCAIGLGVFLKYRKFTVNPLLMFLPVIPFLIMEVLFPLLGPVFIKDIPLAAALSSGRILLIYLPVIIFFVLTTNKEAESFDHLMQKLLRISVAVNLVYGLVQISVVSKILPKLFLITMYLKPLSVDEHYRILDGFRASGFFTNTTGLAVFGIVVLSYFLSKYSISTDRSDLIYAFLGFALILLSTARAAYAVSFLIILMALFTIPRKQAIRLFFSLIGIMTAIVIFAFLTAGFNVFFKRIIRLKDGLGADYSFNHRLEVLWPKVFEKITDYPFGTFIPPTKIVGLIDSGYITYYAQGKWLFIAALVFMILGNFYLIITSLRVRKNWPSLFLMFLFTYIILAMVINIPMRSPVIIFFILYGLGFLNYERRFQ